MSCELPGEVLFQSTRPSRGATWLWTITAGRWLRFQSTRPSRGATRRWTMPGKITRNFNPRAPRGARLRSGDSFGRSGVFQSTRPSRGATVFHQKNYQQQGISIHAPLAGRDPTATSPPSFSTYFNPRAPRGARPNSNIAAIIFNLFQSTRPSRGATITATGVLGLSNNFNPRAPRGARRIWLPLTVILPEFQSTRPSRGATQYFKTETQPEPISIHAPRAGRDAVSETVIRQPKNFNPRAPCGARPALPNRYPRDMSISIHAPLAGRDVWYRSNT